MIRAIDLGFPQKEIAEASYRYQRQLETGEKVMVGVNKYELEREPPLEVLRVPPAVEDLQVKRVRERKRARHAETVRARLAAVREAAAGSTNLMPPIIDAVKAGCTVGEISDIFRDVFGVYRDPAWL
jgi:methylmalonyl-CoA mutase, N-terminal domain